MNWTALFISISFVLNLWCCSHKRVLSYDVLHSYCISIVSRVIEKKHPKFFDIKSLISQKLYHGSISKFDTSQFTKFANFYCL